ncbi:MAG TPA: xanthine dehydrogenase family protein molybdopterin-binding subunit [Acidobacteriaceae bacterium]
MSTTPSITPTVSQPNPGTAPTSIGAPVNRLDGPAKVTGAAKYAAEFPIPNLCYAVMVTSTIAKGTIQRMDTAAAQRAPGVISILTPANTAKLPQNGKAGVHPPAGRVLSLLQDNTVEYNNQPIAVVVAETLNQALHAASLVKVKYQAAAPKLDFEGGFPTAHPAGHGRDPADVSAGKVTAGLAAAEVRIDHIYTTPMQNHNPLEPHATIAQWDGERLTLHDATQYVAGVKQTVAKTLGLPEDNVRVLCPYTGGGFGCKGSTWSHVLLAAIAAKAVNRPVKLVLERPQMFGPVGGRPRTHQHIVLGAKRDGTLTAMQHDVYSHTSEFEDFAEPSSSVTRMLYASDAIETSQRLVPLSVGTPTFMRAPGEATGTFALEIALDELACELKMDPIALRLKNYAEKDPTNNREFSSKHLRECYQQASERFGWSRRNPEPRSTRQGHELVGWGMATATYSANRSSGNAKVTFEPNGRVTVLCGSQDLGTGTYTILAQTAAATLKMPISLFDAKLGDSELPKAPVSGGSQSAASITPAVQAAAQQVMLKLYALSVTDAGSPFHGLQPDQFEFADGRITHKARPGASDTVTALIARNRNEPITAAGSAQPDQESDAYSNHSFGAVFAEVGVDEALGTVRVRRLTAVYDIGTLLTGKAGISQLIGGLVWAVSLALHEETHMDMHYGRAVNNNLAEYHVPTNLDIPELDVSVLNIPDKRFNPLGARGIGEIGITGASAAIVNAIYHATGKRFRDAPVTPDRVMAASLRV